MEKGLQRPLGKGQGHFKCIKSKGQTASNMFFEVTKVHMFLFVLTVSLNMTNSLFSIILTSMWKQGCSAPWGRVRGILSALNQRSDSKQNVFLSSLRCTCFYLSSNMTNSLFSIILTSMWKQGCSAPWGRVRGILSALNPKVTQQAKCFLRSLRCTCFYLSSLCP